MRKRKLGQGLEVSAEGLGCMGMSDFYGVRDEKEAMLTIHHALDRGIDFLDTADMYGPFTNEILVGRAIKSRRDMVIVATKFGNERDAEGNYVGINGSPDYVRSACDASLKRLNIDYIDLYYQHRVDKKVPVEETWGALKGLVESGKVRHLGISEAAPETIRKAHAVHPISAVQSEWSLWSRDVEENGVLATVRELGIGFVAYSPLGRGFLSGEIRSIADLDPNDVRRGHPRFQGENFAKNLELLERVKEIANRKAITPSQLALAWVLAQGNDVVPIPGTKQTKYLDENIAALDVELSAEDLVLINSAAPMGATAGDRYANMSNVNI
jgi:aryl-alcohol dehydrogenase-like predicted oxidoreductase